MPTRDPSAALDLDSAHQLARQRSFPAPPAAGDPNATRKVGLEPERFAVRIGADGAPAGRLPLAGESGVLARIDALHGSGLHGSGLHGSGRVGSKSASSKLASSSADNAEVSEQLAQDRALIEARDRQRMPPIAMLSNGGSLTFEPGAQIEHSTAVHAGISEALDDVERVEQALARRFSEHGTRLISIGLDPWSTPDDVPQQLDADRYRSMAAYFAARGPAGAQMMRLSCSLQVNVDLGSGATREERYALSNLLSPALVASFSSSPERPGDARFHCRRARVWQEIDPTRAGFPARFLTEPTASAADVYADAVLDADVLLFRTASGGAVTGQPGLRFRDWIANGTPEHGFPTIEDLEYHLTTLFFESRARGFYELRAIDALPHCWRPAAAVFSAALLYDDSARGAALERLSGWREDLNARWWRSAEVGFADAELASATQDLWRLALDAAARMPADVLRAEHLDDATAYYERFAARGMAPADELRAAAANGPAAAFDWAIGRACGEREGVRA